ncbi:MAG: hypothetical protein ACFCU3_00655 [Verrucomicrobiales bacterium]
MACFTFLAQAMPDFSELDDFLGSFEVAGTYVVLGFGLIGMLLGSVLLVQYLTFRLGTGGLQMSSWDSFTSFLLSIVLGIVAYAVGQMVVGDGALSLLGYVFFGIVFVITGFTLARSIEATDTPNMEARRLVAGSIRAGFLCLWLWVTLIPLPQWIESRADDIKAFSAQKVDELLANLGSSEDEVGTLTWVDIPPPPTYEPDEAGGDFNERSFLITARLYDLKLAHRRLNILYTQAQESPDPQLPALLNSYLTAHRQLQEEIQNLSRLDP